MNYIDPSGYIKAQPLNCENSENIAQGNGENGRNDNLIEGRPEGGNPRVDELIRKDTARVKSEDFIEYLESIGETPSTWRKIMETWETPDGDLYERHYWTNGIYKKGGKE